MRNLLIMMCLLLGYHAVNSQNLVTNYSFERLKTPVPACSYSGDPETFNQRVEGWQTFKIITPDILVTDSIAKANCFLPAPHKGRNMIGLIMYHPFQDAQFAFDYHEFVQGTLAKPLEKGKTYRVSCWTWTNDSLGSEHLCYVFKRKVKTRPVFCNNFGFYFCSAPINPNEQFNESIDVYGIRPQVNITEVVTTNNGQWQKLTATFTADGPHKYFVFGNFFSDAVTATNIPLEEREAIDLFNTSEQNDFWKKKKRIAYYLFDDFAVVEESAYAALERSIRDDKKYVLPDHLLFASGKSTLQPAAFPALDQLATYLLKNTTTKMEIGGHTDAEGAESANQTLSEQRAQAVHRYLLEKNIPANQISWRGYGESQPIGDNTTESGKQKNRRVECVVQ